MTQHEDDFYNGVYCRAEDWNNAPHFEKEDGSAHLYLFGNFGDWQFW